MKNMLKKSLLVGVGALSMTKDKAMKMVQELEEKGEVTSDEAKDFVNEMMERGEREREVLRNTVKNEMEKILHAAGLVTKREMDALEERLKRLESRIGPQIEGAGAPTDELNGLSDNR